MSFRAIAFASLLCFLFGCEKKSPSKPVTQPGDHGQRSVDEMVALSSKVIPRKDRPLFFGPRESATVGTEVLSGHEDLIQIAPGEDWASERWSAQALDRLAELVNHPEKAATIASPDYAGTTLSPSPLPVVFKDRHTVVKRFTSADLNSTVQGPVALQASLRELLAHFTKSRRISWKPIGIDLESGDVFVTRVLVEISGTTTDGGRGEIHAAWTCRWQQKEPPILLGIQLSRLEKTVADSAPWFTDVTGPALANLTQSKEQALTGVEFWSQRITRYGDMYLTGHHGLAVGDVNGDGLDDLYVCDGGSLPNRLYVQATDGSLEDVSAESGVNFLEDSRGALLVDLDNDGDQDLVVVTVAMIALARNDGQGNFTLVGGHMGAPYGGSVSAADPDNDGDLDLYVCVYEGAHESGARGFEARTPIPFHDARNGGRNVLLENLGDFQFADATAAFGLESNNTRWSFAAAWEDFDRDGDPDLYVANDFGRNNLYRNDNGRFVDIAAEAGVEDMAAGMSVAWGDYNRDGLADLYVGNMFSSAGRRISYQQPFHPERDEAALLGKQRMARGNSLFAGGKAGIFDDASEPAGVTMGRWAWSSAFADLNNDGWEDLVITNGYLSNRLNDDL